MAHLPSLLRNPLVVLASLSFVSLMVAAKGETCSLWCHECDNKKCFKQCFQKQKAITAEKEAKCGGTNDGGKNDGGKNGGGKNGGGNDADADKSEFRATGNCKYCPSCTAVKAKDGKDLPEDKPGISFEHFGEQCVCLVNIGNAYDEKMSGYEDFFATDGMYKFTPYEIRLTKGNDCAMIQARWAKLYAPVPRPDEARAGRKRTLISASRRVWTATIS